MNFCSDNAYGAAPEMLEALRRRMTARRLPTAKTPSRSAFRPKCREIFDREVAAFPVITGTAANALALATTVPPHGAVICQRGSHIVSDECGAPEFFTHGAKLVTVEGRDGSSCRSDRRRAIAIHQGCVHHPQPAAVSVAQASELGLCYRRERYMRLRRSRSAMR